MKNNFLNSLTPEDHTQMELMRNDPEMLRLEKLYDNVIAGSASPEELAEYEVRSRDAEDFIKSGMIYGDEGDPVHSPGFKMRKPEE